MTYDEFLMVWKKYKKAEMYGDELECLKHLYVMDKTRTYPLLEEYRDRISTTFDTNPNNYTLLKESYLISAKDKFEDYCIFLEWNRDVKKAFYLPRREKLKILTDSLQKLADGDIDLLCISLPPGVGKSTLAIFFLTWLAGKNPNEPILGGSHNNSFLAGVYDECLRIISSDDEYLWKVVFDNVALKSTNAKDLRIDLDKGKRFETLEFSSIGSGNAGKVRAVQLLYCDDLVDGIETALNKDRLDKLWQQYYTDLRQRKQGDHCRELHIATRWSIHDVIGRLQNQYEESDRAKFIAIPALDDNDESNFDYPYGIGFTTEFYHEQRDIMDDPSWRALYMNVPIEREGQLYSPDELRRYYTLPDADPDAIMAVCDIADGGGDYWVLPIAYKYGNDYYIEDFICDNNKPDIVEQRILEKLIKHNVHIARFESNRAGGRVADNMQKMVREKGGITKITTKWNNSNKETRIIVAAGYVKERFLFKADSEIKTDKEYTLAMKFLTGYTMSGKNKHDDIPDAMAMLVDYVGSFDNNHVTIMKRPF